MLYRLFNKELINTVSWNTIKENDNKSFPVIRWISNVICRGLCCVQLKSH